MGTHKAKYTQSEDRTRFFVRCTCRVAPPKGFLHQWQAQDWYREHEAEVAKVQARLAGQPTLNDTYRHYREMSENESVSANDRVLWRRLAEELGRRLGVDSPDAEPDGLF